MVPEIVSLTDNVPMAAFAAGIIVGLVVAQIAFKLRPRVWRKRNRRRWGNDGPRAPGQLREPLPSKRPDATDQLRIVMAADFLIQPLLNKREARVFKELDRSVVARNPTWQVMAQVSLGEILRCADTDAYGCINSKRVDLLLVDDACMPRHAIEYQGGAHYQGTAAARDAVKKEALRRAGIGYHEVVAGQTTPAELRRLVEKLVVVPALAE